MKFQPHDHACPYNQQPTARPGFRARLSQQVRLSTALIFICRIKVFRTPNPEFIAQATDWLVCRSSTSRRRTMLRGEIVLDGLRGSLHSAQISSQGPSVKKKHKLIETMRGCVTIKMTKKPDNGHEKTFLSFERWRHEKSKRRRL